MSFKGELQGLTVQSTTEAKLVAAVLMTKESVVWSNIMKEFEFGALSDSVPVHIDNTSALHVAGNRTYSSRVKHVDLRYVLIQKVVKEGRTNTHYEKADN